MAVVGLRQTLYQVSEDAGAVTVCVVVSNPTNVCPVAFSFSVDFTTVSGSAGNKVYYHTCMNNMCTAIIV